MHRSMKGFAPVLCMALLVGCGGGGSAPPPASPGNPPATNDTRGPLRLDATNYQTALRASMGTAVNAFSYIKLGGDMADNLFERPVPRDVSALICPDGGWTLLDIGDRNLDGFFNVGDYVTQSYEDCENSGATIDGIIRIELQGATPKDGGRELQVWVTVLNLSVTQAASTSGATGINFTGPVWYTHAPTYQQFKLGGAQFGSTNVAGVEQASALVVDYLQRQDTGTYSLSLGGNVDSGAFAGTFEFATYAPFTGTIGQFPAAGRMILVGRASSSATLSEEGAAAGNAATVRVAVDSNGDGTAESSVNELAWTNVVPREFFDAFRNPVVVTPPRFP